MSQSELIKFLSSTSYAAKDIAARVGNRIHYTYVPSVQSNTFPRIYIDRISREDNANLDGTKGDLIEESFAVEVISNKSSDVTTIVDEFWQDVHAYYGAMSTALTAKGIFIENQSDDYEPKGIGNDIGLDVATLSLRLVR